MKSLLKLTFFVRKCSQVFASLKEFAMKFESAQISRKSVQVDDQTSHKSTQIKTCGDLRSRLIRPLII